MSWFKRLSIVKRVSLNKMPVSSNDPGFSKHTTAADNSSSRSGGESLSSGSKKCGECTGSDADPMMASTSTSSTYVNPQLVDPEEFFEDPYHVKMYRDEREFLDMLSEYVIVEDPNKRKEEMNFFSADFEAELINFKRSTSTGSIILEDQFRIYEKSDPEHNNNNIDGDNSNLNTNICDVESDSGDYKFFWGHWIKPGSIPNQDEMGSDNSGVNKTGDKRHAPVTTQGAKRKRTRSRSMAFKHSIMSALQKSSEQLAMAIHGSSDSIDSSSDSTNGCEYDRFCTQCTDDADQECKEQCDRDEENDVDVELLFGLDDQGNIILDMNHIHEEKGYGFLMCRTKKLYRSIPKGEEVDEKTMRGKRLLGFLKHFTRCLWILFACGHPRNKSHYGGPEDSVRAYTLQLAADHSSTFSQNIENFIACTKESREPAPQVVMRNMRQFMNGMKNYLVKHGEGDFHQEVQKARSHLKSDEFLNLDAILEAVMHQLVVLPLREHLYGLFVDYYTRTADIQLLVQNVKYACARNAPEFGIRPSVAPPSTSALAQIGVLLTRLQEAELPLDKLELFLCVISAIFDATGCPRGQQLGADDFLPILVYVVAKCGFVGAEIEAEYMWGLLQPALLNGEAGYYLTALCSAVHVLKSFMGTDNESGTGSLDWRSSSLPASSSVLRVIIPDECNGSLQTRTLPVRPHTTTRDVCRIIAHKARITNPQDYGLFKLVDGEETLLVESECPQDARIAARGKHCMLAYKRLDAKIAWPTTATSA